MSEGLFFETRGKKCTICGEPADGIYEHYDDEGKVDKRFYFCDSHAGLKFHEMAGWDE